jgi:DNA repair protein RecO (recombination protein O)
MPERVDTAALVIQRFAYGETSQVVHLLTEALGRVVVLAKGAWREKNGYEGPLDLLEKGRVSLSLVQGRELGLLTGRRLVTNHPALRRDLRRFTAAAHVLRQVLHFEAVGAGGGDAYRLVERALAALETVAPARISLLLLAFDARFAQLHGVLPEVSHCVRCGSPQSLARFVPADGGVVCSICLARPDEGAPIDRATAALVRDLASVPFAQLADPAPAALSRARRLLDVHLQWHADATQETRRPARGARGVPGASRKARSRG